MTGRLYGVGVGPGDPELVTVKAARLIARADVVAYHCAQHGRSNARAIAAGYFSGRQVEERLVYPVTAGDTSHEGGYQGAIDEFYAESAERLAVHLRADRTVVVLSEGDPLFYGSYMHMHKRLAHLFPTEVVPGVTSVSGAAAALGRPLVERDEVLTVLPGTLPPDVLADRLASTDAAVVMKLGRTFHDVRAALDKAGRLDEAFYVERATTTAQRTARLADVDPDEVPYFSVVVVPSPLNATHREPVRPEALPVAGEVVVVGLGPAGPEWLTPEAQAALVTADDLVGYVPYVDRVPANDRQRRHRSDNKVESERARMALDLALEGRRVAVVSSGDPGVFAMASAVLEVAAEPGYREVPVRVLPGLTAAQAVASRVGAPLGHDYCVLSLSDRLKPWEVVAKRVSAAAEADLVLAIYNPASRSRRWQVDALRDLLIAHRLPTTPVVIGRDVGGPEESITVLPLAELRGELVDMRCLLLIGSSQTVVDDHGKVWTPRRYPA